MFSADKSSSSKILAGVMSFWELLNRLRKAVIALRRSRMGLMAEVKDVKRDIIAQGRGSDSVNESKIETKEA